MCISERIHRFSKIFIFVIHLHQFLTSLLDHDFPCRCITLRARTALRVICDLRNVEAKTRQGSEPPAGPPKMRNTRGESTFSKISTFPAHARVLYSTTPSYDTHQLTLRMYSWIGLDLTEVGKLLRSKLNSQILRNLHFL